MDALFFEPFAFAEAHGSAVDQRLDAFAGDAARRRDAHEASAALDGVGDENACERMGDAVFRARGESQDRTVGKPLADDGREERPAFGDAAALRERDGADVLERAEDADVLHEDLLCAALFQRLGQGERGGEEEGGRACEEEHGEEEDRCLQGIESHGLPEGGVGDGEQQAEGEKAQGGIVRDGEERRVLGRLRRLLLLGRVACGRFLFLCGRRLASRTPRFPLGEAALLGAQSFEFAIARLGLLLSPFLLLALLALDFALRHHLFRARRHDAFFLVERRLLRGEAHFEVFAAEREGQEDAERREEKLMKESIPRQRHLYDEEEARDDGGEGADGDERIGARRLEEQTDAAHEGRLAREQHGEREDELDSREEERRLLGRERSQVYAERGGREQSRREGESQKRQGQDDEEGGAQIFFEACFLLLRC